MSKQKTVVMLSTIAIIFILIGQIRAELPATKYLPVPIVQTPPAQCELGTPVETRSKEQTITHQKIQKKNSTSTILPVSIRPVLLESIAKDVAKDFYINTENLCAENPGNEFQTCFRPEGIEVRNGNGRLHLSLTAWGRAHSLNEVSGAVPHAQQARVEYKKEGLVEWYLNLPCGLEQGFTVNEEPSGEGNLTLKIKANTMIQDEDGTLRWGNLQYGGLYAVDAVGKALHARSYIKEGNLFIEVEDGSAVYPVIIDPLIEAQKLVASDGLQDNTFGSSVAVSDDGNTIIVGAPEAYEGFFRQGAAYVFVRNGTTWIEEQKIFNSDGYNGDKFGTSVALSGDGNTALVSAQRADLPRLSYNDRGAAYVFVRNGTTWTEQQKLIASDGDNQDWFGDSTALSYDGNTGVVGAVNVEDLGGPHSKGAAYVFVRNGTTWTEQQRLTSSGGAVNNSETFGKSVALSDDGNTTIVGAYNAQVNLHNSQGAAYVFVRSDTTWTQQQQISASDGATNDWFGTSVALSGDGNTALVGSLQADVGDNADQGAAYVFVRDDTTWIEQDKFTASDGSATDSFGRSVALSHDGNHALVGTEMQDAAYPFEWDGATWTALAKITPSDGPGENAFGFTSFTAALSEDGSIAIVGAPYADVGGNTDQGAAYVFIDTDLLVDPLTLDFGEVVINDSSLPLEVTIANLGTDALNVTDIVLASATDYSLNVSGGSSPCGMTNPTIVASGSCTVAVSFNPLSVATFNDTLTINSDDPNRPSADVFLTGTGLDDTVTAITSATGTGTITIDTSDTAGTFFSQVHVYLDTDAVLNQTGKPTNYQFPDGLVAFTVNAVTPIGGTIDVTLISPTFFPPEAKYYKVDANGFYEYPHAVIDGNTVTLTLTDNGDRSGGDSGIANDSMIIDPGGVALPMIDSDEDSVLDDGDHNGTPGDNPCPDGITENCDDNCPDTPNPSQEDTYPPGGNGIGDACDCECDFDCDRDVDADDVAEFLNHFGRFQFNNPCSNDDPCHGDCECDTDVDADDVEKFLEDFGRFEFNNPCPPCVAENWCVYP